MFNNCFLAFTGMSVLLLMLARSHGHVWGISTGDSVHWSIQHLIWQRAKPAAQENTDWHNCSPPPVDVFKTIPSLELTALNANYSKWEMAFLSHFRCPKLQIRSVWWRESLGLIIEDLSVCRTSFLYRTSNYNQIVFFYCAGRDQWEGDLFHRVSICPPS